MNGPAPQAPLLPVRTGSTTGGPAPTVLAVEVGLSGTDAGLVVLAGDAVVVAGLAVELSGTHQGLVVPGRDVVESGTHHGLVVLGGDAVDVGGCTGGATGTPAPIGLIPNCGPNGKKLGHQGMPIGKPGFDWIPGN